MKPWMSNWWHCRNLPLGKETFLQRFIWDWRKEKLSALYLNSLPSWVLTSFIYCPHLVYLQLLPSVSQLFCCSEVSPLEALMNPCVIRESAPNMVGEGVQEQRPWEALYATLLYVLSCFAQFLQPACESLLYLIIHWLLNERAFWFWKKDIVTKHNSRWKMLKF